MKKLSFLILFILIVIHNSFASNEGILSFGITYQNISNLSGDYLQNAGGNIGMVGFCINPYIFWNSSNIGLFCSGNWLAAVYLTNPNNLKEYGSNYIGIIFGPGFRYILSDNMTLLMGVGIDFWGQSIKAELKNNTVYKDSELNLGFGGQFGFKFDFTNTVCIMILTNIGYTFGNCIESSLQWSIKPKFAIAPFIGIGFNRYDSKHWGKP
jgi:hypothetical protein